MNVVRLTRRDLKNKITNKKKFRRFDFLDSTPGLSAVRILLFLAKYHTIM